MATRKEKPTNLREMIQKQRDDFLRTHRFIREEFYVVELFPSTEDEFGGYIPKQESRCSPYYETRALAEQFIKEHDPASGSTFVIKKRVLREHTEQSWFPF